MISQNPLLGPEWEPLGQVLMLTIERLRKVGDETFVVQTYGHKYGLSPHTSPFIQGCINALGQVQVEVSSNLMVRPELTEEQYESLEFYGWIRPYKGEIDDTGQKEDENPNFSRYFELKTDALDIAEFALTTLVGVYEITVEDFFGFPSPGLANRVAELNKLSRLKATEGDPTAEIFAMAGKHLELV